MNLKNQFPFNGASFQHSDTGENELAACGNLKPGVERKGERKAGSGESATNDGKKRP